MALKIQRSFLPSALGPVVRLLFRRSPLAISWFISLIVIDSLDTHMRGRLSHICEKILERFHPPIAYLYPTASVAFKNWMRWIIASLPDMAPRMKGAGRFRFSVLGIQSHTQSARFRAFASTTSSPFMQKLSRRNEVFFSARTFAEPIDFVASSLHSFRDRQSIKYPACQIDPSLGISESPISHNVKYNTNVSTWGLMLWQK
jgi:hypothetical protein